MERKEEQMKKKLIPVVIAIVLIIIVAAFGLGGQILEKYSYSTERADLPAYFNIQGETEAAIILQDTLIEEKARVLDGTYYFDLDTVHKYLNARFYEDKKEKLLLYTLPDQMVRVQIGTGEVSYKRDFQAEEGAGDGTDTTEKETKAYTIARYEGDVLYVAVDFVKEYTNFSYQSFTAPERIQLYTAWGDVKSGKINQDTAVRVKGGVKSEILADAALDERVTVLEEMETWSKVKTKESIIGYVENKRLSEIRTDRQVPVTDYQEPVYTSLTRDYKISMGWHPIAGIAGNDTLYEVVRNTKGLNVISPTWFLLSDNEGGITSYASRQYVDTAHDMGLEVWALAENIQNRNTLNMYDLLSSTSDRETLIRNLIQEALDYGVDGINIDFEEIQADAGEHFIQFIRELSIPCREHKLVLSIDNYVPYHYNDHYNRREQGVVADYVIIMGYDEHYAGGDEAGSVASIDYVENGIVNTLEQVPAEKIINAVPFYTRIWETKGAKITSQTVGMVMAEEWVSNHNITPVWDEETCQNYCEYTAGESKYQAWLEDEESLRVKFNVMDTHKIGGAAFWRLGFEKESVWEVVEEYLN